MGLLQVLGPATVTTMVTKLPDSSIVPKIEVSLKWYRSYFQRSISQRRIGLAIIKSLFMYSNDFDLMISFISYT